LAAIVLPIGPVHADDRVVSAEALAAASRAGEGVSTDTYAAENLLYFVLYGGGNLPGAAYVTQHLTGGVSTVDDDVPGTMSWIAGLGVALIPPRFDWFACETHLELGVTELAGASMFTLQAGLTLRATVPLRYLSLNLGAGPLLTTFIHDFTDRTPTPDQPATFEQWDGALGLRLLAGVHFLVGEDIRLFVDYRHDLYADAIGQPPASSDPGAPPFRGDEVGGLAIQSLVGGLEVNVPEYQQSSFRGKTPVVAVPLIAVLIVAGLWAVPVLSEE